MAYDEWIVERLLDEGHDLKAIRYILNSPAFDDAEFFDEYETYLKTQEESDRD
jgi:hypothetical protein